MMNTLRLSIILLCCVMLGCEQPYEVIDDSQLIQASTIKPGSFTISANVDRAVFDRSITITMKCLPVISGKGVIGLGGRKANGEIDRRLLSPVHDTVTIFDDSYYTIYVPVEFTANQEFTQTWSIQLLERTKPNGGSYFFDGAAHIDSIFIADSNRTYGIYSEVARKHCPRRLGWEPNAVCEGRVHL